MNTYTNRNDMNISSEYINDIYIYIYIYIYMNI